MSAARLAEGAPRQPLTSFAVSAGPDQLAGIDVGERCEGKFAEPINSAEDTAGSEGDDRAEERIVDDPGQSWPLKS